MKKWINESMGHKWLQGNAYGEIQRYWLLLRTPFQLKYEINDWEICREGGNIIGKVVIAGEVQINHVPRLGTRCFERVNKTWFQIALGPLSHGRSAT